MIPAVNIYSSVAVYAQIENEVRFAIASGKLKANDRLPSVREMSETLGVNPNTVARPRFSGTNESRCADSNGDAATRIARSIPKSPKCVVPGSGSPAMCL